MASFLINKLGIRDEVLLAQTESVYVLAKASYLELHPLPGKFDLAHYQSIHHFLFSNLYEWAGALRKVDLSKKGMRCSLEAGWVLRAKTAKSQKNRRFQRKKRSRPVKDQKPPGYEKTIRTFTQVGVC